MKRFHGPLSRTFLRAAAAGALCAVLFSAFPLTAGGPAPAELYGKPLRGLSAVPLADVAGAPEKFAGRAIRVAGAAEAGSASGVTISEGSASLRLETDGTFSLPGKLSGALVTAEGKLRTGASPVFVATGVEVKR